MRYLWFDFLTGSQAIVFMVDGADEDRLEEAHWELSEMLSDVSFCVMSPDISVRRRKAPDYSFGDFERHEHCGM